MRKHLYLVLATVLTIGMGLMTERRAWAPTRYVTLKTPT